MNLRILKKLSKRAAPMLAALGDRRDQFRAAKGENYHASGGFPRKQWERTACHPSYTGREGCIVFVTRAGRSMVMSAPWHPLEGTVMVGGMGGGETPEWDEETAWDSFRAIVLDHFTDWHPDREPRLLRQLDTPRLVFAAAAEILA